LEAFLGIKLARIPVRREPIGRHKQEQSGELFEFLKPAMLELGYET
jgi:hypothetical protein